MNPCLRRRRGLVENEQQGENKKMKSIVVEEQEGGSKSETGFVDLDKDTIFNVLKRVDAVTIARAALVNKLWRIVAWDERLWEPIALRYFASNGMLEAIDVVRKSSRAIGFRRLLSKVVFFPLTKPLQSESHSIDPLLLLPLTESPPSDFYSIDPQALMIRSVESEEQGKNKKMKIVVEEQEEEEGSESESKTGFVFVDLEPDTLRNVLERVGDVTLARAACVNKLWRKVAEDERLWKPISLRICANAGGFELLCGEANPILGRSFVRKFYSRRPPSKSPPSDFYSIDPQVFSNRIRPWK